MTSSSGTAEQSANYRRVPEFCGTILGMGRIGLWCAAATAVAAVVVACSPGAIPEGRESVPPRERKSTVPTVLEVRVTPLPENAGEQLQSREQVVVSGRGRTWRLSASKKLTVAPGDYTVRTVPVRGDNARYLGAEDSFRVTVPDGRTTRVDAGYRVVIPDTTKVVSDYRNPPIVTYTADQVVLSPGRYADGLRAGDAIVVAEGPRTPRGLVRRVLSVRRAGGQVLARTAPTSIREVFGRSVLRFESANSGPTRSYGTNSGQGEPRRGSESGDEDWSLIDAQITAGFGDVEPRVWMKVRDFNIDVDGDIELDGSRVRLRLTPGVRYDTSIGLEIPRKVTGEKERRVDLKGVPGAADGGCKRLVGRLFRVGPVSLSCSVQGVVGVNADVTGGMDLSVDLRGQHNATIEWANGLPVPVVPVRGGRPRVKVDYNWLAAGTARAKAGLNFGFGGGAHDLIDFRLGMDMMYGLEAKVDLPALEVSGYNFAEGGLVATLDAKLPWENNGLHEEVRLLSFRKEGTPTWAVKLDPKRINPGPDLPPPPLDIESVDELADLLLDDSTLGGDLSAQTPKRPPWDASTSPWFFPCGKPVPPPLGYATRTYSPHSDAPVQVDHGLGEFDAEEQIHLFATPADAAAAVRAMREAPDTCGLGVSGGRAIERTPDNGLSESMEGLPDREFTRSGWNAGARHWKRPDNPGYMSAGGAIFAQRDNVLVIIATTAIWNPPNGPFPDPRRNWPRLRSATEVLANLAIDRIEGR